MTEIMINIATDFTRVPGPRFVSQGDFSGEKFRKAFLVGALRAADKVIVNLDGTEGYGSSFIDEAFGGLVRAEGFSKDELFKKLELISAEDPSYKEEAIQAIQDAKPKAA